MKREKFVMMIVVLLMMTVGNIACAQNVPLIIDPDKVDQYLAERKDTINVYDCVEQMPSFPGGTQKLKEFIEENLRYPKELEESCVQGRVIVRFIVERNGKLSNVKVVKSVHPVLDKELGGMLFLEDLAFLLPVDEQNNHHMVTLPGRHVDTVEVPLMHGK